MDILTAQGGVCGTIFITICADKSAWMFDLELE
jgi:hypothetical protein